MNRKEMSRGFVIESFLAAALVVFIAVTCVIALSGSPPTRLIGYDYVRLAPQASELRPAETVQPFDPIYAGTAVYELFVP